MDELNMLVLDEQAFMNMPIIDTSISLRVCEIKDTSAVKSKLIKLYGDVKAYADGRELMLSELGDARTVTIPAQVDFKKQRYNVADIIRVTARLTQEDGGCPWDRAQTHDSIRINMIEEAYEAVDAIDKRDKDNMREEFGDVLLQSVLQSDIAKRSGEFDFDDVCDGLCKKLISRHTFIFGEDSATTPSEALGLWEKAKSVEKHYDSVKTQLGKLPDNFPALLLGQKTYKKLKKAGEQCDPQAELAAALQAKDYAKAIAACVALLADEGKDAEVELNKLMKAKIAAL